VLFAHDYLLGEELSLLWGQDIFVREYMYKINKMSEFYMIFARQINKIPEVYIIFPQMNKIPELSAATSSRMRVGHW